MRGKVAPLKRDGYDFIALVTYTLSMKVECKAKSQKGSDSKHRTKDADLNVGMMPDSTVLGTVEAGSSMWFAITDDSSDIRSAERFFGTLVLMDVFEHTDITSVPSL